MIYNGIEELIGNTPLIKLNNIEKKFNLPFNLYAKTEYFNPSGSVKDRVAFYMIKDAEKKGIIKDGATIIEPTSGNTGIGLAMLGASMKYKVILTMPETYSKERILLFKAYGAEVVLTDGKLGMKGAIDKAKELKDQIKNSFIPSQFDNPSNVEAHYNTTGKEIYEDLDGKINVFLACIGSGGTLSGTAKYLKEKNKEILTLGIEPLSSPLITKNQIGAHKIQGIGANFIPKNYINKFVDKVLTCKDEDAYEFTRILAKEEGLLCGISSGAVLSAVIDNFNTKEYKDKNIVILLPDTGMRYLSTKDLF